MKSCLIRCALAGVASLLTGGFLGYSYGAYAYSRAEYVFKAAQNLEIGLRNKLRNLL
jgi:hypothetical protein